MIMEVCGTHTSVIYRTGLRPLLREVVELRSGPGCPICVTSTQEVDAIIDLARRKDVIIATFGDMLKVPGSTSSLERERARGGRVKIIYSPFDAIELARTHGDLDVIIVGVGFETTAPLMGLTLIEAHSQRLNNFSLYSMHKLMPPVLRILLDGGNQGIDGFILPGHVAAIIGSRAFSFIAEEYGVPGVVTGFEPMDILQSVLFLMEMMERGEARVINGYTRVVKDGGNPRALQVMDRCFYPDVAPWRGFGSIPDSGLNIKSAFDDYNAAIKYHMDVSPSDPVKGECRCGDILQGMISPVACPLFKVICTPTQPCGPCMVSTEGACATYYNWEFDLPPRK